MTEMDFAACGRTSAALGSLKQLGLLAAPQHLHPMVGQRNSSRPTYNQALVTVLVGEDVKATG